jgi:hypothetical protein
MAGVKIISPHKGFQEKLARTGVDICVAGGSVSTGKSFGAWLAVAERMLDPNFRGLFLRNNIDDFKQGGGLLDTAEEVFGKSVRIIKSDNPRVEYIPTGAVVEVTHVADQTRAKVEQRFKGGQKDVVLFDEGTGFTWETFVTIATRNRGKTGKDPQLLITTNPKRKHWLRKMVDWYIGEDGLVIKEREGRVRYLFVNGTTVDDIVWGSTKEEVYSQCKGLIDRLVKGAYGDVTPPKDAWKTLIKSFTYYQGRMAENTENLERNTNYIGSVAMAGGANALNYIEGNWNADEDDDKDLLVTYAEAAGVFTNEDQKNGDMWATMDLADTGTDNMLLAAWNGLHIFDLEILTHSTPKENADHAKAFCIRNGIPFSHLIFDAVRAGIYINDWIPEAIPFESYRAPMGGHAPEYMRLKDCCYGKLIFLIKNRFISCEEAVGKRTYVHQNLKNNITIQEEFIEEAKVIQYVDAPNGKKRLMTKKEMNKNLGHGRSMDLMDICAMRMMPLLEIADGFELETGRVRAAEYEDDINNGNRVNIYNDTAFGVCYGGY